MRSAVIEAVGEVVGDSAAIALGGGADSAVAAWALSTSGRETRALFVDHELAGSALLRGSATAVADHLGLNLTVLAGPVADGSNLEDRARHVRRRALLDSLLPGETLVLGHTATDQAETVLMNLMRGAGARGLAAMPRGGAVARPLLGFTRSAVRELADGLELPYADDPANDDPRFLRNRVRSEVLPLLESIRHGAISGVARSAEIAAEDERTLVAAAQAVPLAREPGAVSVALADLEDCGPAIAARVVRGMIESDGRLVRHADVAAVSGVVAGDRRRSQLSGGRFVELEGDRVAIWSSEPAPPDSVELAVPGTVRFGQHAVAIAIGSIGATTGDVLLDRKAVPAVVTIRAAEWGDRIAISGGSKLVHDALAESGVPRRLRAAWPVLVAGAKIAAIPGVRAAVWAAAGGGDELRLRDERAVR